MSLSRRKLADQTLDYMGTGGISRENQHLGFVPAYRDTRTGTVYPSCHADGRPAPVHVLDGLPAELVVRRSADGHVMAVARQVEAGFVRNGRFYTRAEAARWLQRHDADIAGSDLVTA
ncbi:MAG TPA: hypothetical protein ENJ01_06705 [Gammaproteobacteria bacterium]|nr:hypothetical protein [Gammaproteobacteria bacterium]